MPIERRWKLSAAWRAERSFRRVSEGRGCPERTSGKMAWATPRRVRTGPKKSPLVSGYCKLSQHLADHVGCLDHLRGQPPAVGLGQPRGNCRDPE